MTCCWCVLVTYSPLCKGLLTGKYSSEVGDGERVGVSLVALVGHAIAANGEVRREVFSAALCVLVRYLQLAARCAMAAAREVLGRGV